MASRLVRSATSRLVDLALIRDPVAFIGGPIALERDLALISHAVTVINATVLFGLVQNPLQPSLIGCITIARTQLAIQGRVLTVASGPRPIFRRAGEVADRLTPLGRNVPPRSFFVTL